MKVILYITLFFSGALFAQTPENRFQTNGNVASDQEVYNEGENTKFTKALIIPFERKMYMSSVDRDISNKTGMSFQEIRNNMRFAITNELLKSIGTKLPSVSLMHIDTGDVAKELSYIYSSIGYAYEILDENGRSESVDEEPVKTEDDEKTFTKVKGKLNKFGDKVKDKFEKKEEEPVQQSGMQNGQLVTSYDRKERYMKTAIHNVNLLSQLNETYEADVFVFVNQVDISNDYQGQSTNPKQRVKVHYTIFNTQGKEIQSGAAISIFSAKKGDMNAIVQSGFSKSAGTIATAIHKHIFTIVKED